MKTNNFQSKVFNLNALFVFGRHFGSPYLVILRGRTDLNLKPRLFAFLLKAHRNLKRLLGTLSKDDDDGSENVGKKINLRSFKLNQVYLDPLNMPNIGDFSWS